MMTTLLLLARTAELGGATTFFEHLLWNFPGKHAKSCICFISPPNSKFRSAVSVSGHIVSLSHDVPFGSLLPVALRRSVDLPSKSNVIFFSIWPIGLNAIWGSCRVGLAIVPSYHGTIVSHYSVARWHNGQSKPVKLPLSSVYPATAFLRTGNRLS